MSFTQDFRIRGHPCSNNHSSLPPLPLTSFSAPNPQGSTVSVWLSDCLFLG